MRKSVRCLAFLLSVVMLLGAFTITSFAEGEVANVTIKTNTDIAAAGDVITVTVNVANNYYATSMRWPVLFSNNFFELVEGSAGATEKLTITIGGSAKCNETPDNTVYTPTYSSEEYTGILFQWTAEVSSSEVKPYNKERGMDCFTFQLRVKDDVELGTTGNIVIPEDYPRFYNYILTDMEKPFSPDKVVQCKDLVHNFTNATVKCGEAVIYPAEGTDVVIDRENNIIRGIPINTSENLDAYLFISAGTLEVFPSQDNRMGTGTKARLLVNGEVVEEYTVIVAGDLNGDAYVDYTDLILFDLYENYEATPDEYKIMASELNDDGKFNAEDKKNLDIYLNFEGDIDQAAGIVVPFN